MATARNSAAPSRVLIVDDSVVARAVLTRMIAADNRFVVAGAVPGAAQALAFLTDATVDVILLDIEMPGVDGITALPDLLAMARGAKVLIVSSSCAEGAAATVQALALGAADTLVKPAGSAFAGQFAGMLAEKLGRLLEAVPAPVRGLPAQPPMAPFDVIAIGASTGGIHALTAFLRAMPSGLTQPILITQHLPASFTQYFAAQIAVIAARPCDIASDGLRLQPGRIVVARGDAHLVVSPAPDGGGMVRLSSEPSPTGNVPSVDPMFASCADLYGPRLLAIVLSGMGRDGLVGAARVSAQGGRTIVQDRATSVVWGMPGAVANAGLADAVLPPDAIGAVLAQECARC